MSRDEFEALPDAVKRKAYHVAVSEHRDGKAVVAYRAKIGAEIFARKQDDPTAFVEHCEHCWSVGEHFSTVGSGVEGYYTCEKRSLIDVARADAR